jgi:hypothetical protein
MCLFFGVSDITMEKVPKNPVQVITPGSFRASKTLKARAKFRGKSKAKYKAKSSTVQNTTPSPDFRQLSPLKIRHVSLRIFGCFVQKRRRDYPI